MNFAQKAVFRKVMDTAQLVPPRIIGVSGIDTSGKTKFSLLLSEYLQERGLNTQLIHLDDFHNPRKARNHGVDPVDSYIENAFDLDRLVDNILLPFSRGDLVDRILTLLDLDTDEYTKQRHFHIDNKTIVILEGVLLFRKPVVNYLDYKIFLDIGFDEMIRRAEIRDVPMYGIEFIDRYRKKYIPVQKWYISTCSPIQKSDFLVDNTDYENPKIKFNRFR